MCLILELLQSFVVVVVNTESIEMCAALMVVCSKVVFVVERLTVESDLCIYRMNRTFGVEFKLADSYKIAKSKSHHILLSLIFFSLSFPTITRQVKSVNYFYGLCYLLYKDKHAI